MYWPLGLNVSIPIITCINRLSLLKGCSLLHMYTAYIVALLEVPFVSAIQDSPVTGCSYVSGSTDNDLNECMYPRRLGNYQQNQRRL